MTECSSPFEKVISYIQKVSAKEKKTLTQRVLKLQEEVGEIAEAVLKEEMASGMGRKKKRKDEIPAECVDIILVAIDIFFSTGKKDADLHKLLLKKAAKWQSKQSK